MNIKGETIQNGEPTPEHPVEIENKINILLAVDDENNSEKEYRLPFLTNIEQQAIETVLSELEKKDKRLNRQFKLLQKRDKEIEELKADNSHQWEERCKLTFELEKKDKIINEMAKWLYEDDTSFGYGNLKSVNTPEKIKQYFERKVEGK